MLTKLIGMIRKMFGSGKSDFDTNREQASEGEKKAVFGAAMSDSAAFETSKSKQRDPDIYASGVELEAPVRVYSVVLIAVKKGAPHPEVLHCTCNAHSKQEALGVALEKEKINDVVYSDVMVVADDMIKIAYDELPDEETDR